MPRVNKATVSDTDLGDAFKHGVNEGFRLLGYVVIFMSLGGKLKQKITCQAHEVPDVVGEFLSSLRGEHYEVGIEIRILAEGDVVDSPAPAKVGGLEEGEDTSIIDAEVVEDE